MAACRKEYSWTGRAPRGGGSGAVVDVPWRVDSRPLARWMTGRRRRTHPARGRAQVRTISSCRPLAGDRAARDGGTERTGARTARRGRHREPGRAGAEDRWRNLLAVTLLFVTALERRPCRRRLARRFWG